MVLLQLPDAEAEVEVEAGTSGLVNEGVPPESVSLPGVVADIMFISSVLGTKSNTGNSSHLFVVVIAWGVQVGVG